MHLHTHCDDWSEIGKDDKLRMAVNVLEDTRIDKLMQSQYPGVIEDYKKVLMFLMILTFTV